MLKTTFEYLLSGQHSILQVENDKSKSLVKTFDALVQKLLLEIRNKFDLCIGSVAPSSRMLFCQKEADGGWKEPSLESGSDGQYSSRTRFMNILVVDGTAATSTSRRRSSDDHQSTAQQPRPYCLFSFFGFINPSLSDFNIITYMPTYDQSVKVVDIVDTFRLQEQPPFDKKQFVGFIKKLIKSLTPKLDAEQQEIFKKNIEGATKFLLSKLSDLQL
ncbi:hypothetical protein Q3G72_015404 [Acer saccharum]|nr:hypothetical protein Q3G72_015404 [Acer saccharum]